MQILLDTSSADIVGTTTASDADIIGTTTTSNAVGTTRSDSDTNDNY